MGTVRPLEGEIKRVVRIFRLLLTTPEEMR